MALKDKIKDGFIAQLALKTNVDIMGYDPCLVYINGVYWGLYGIREHMDDKYIESTPAIISGIAFLDWRN